MATKAMVRKIIGNRQACSMNGICRSPGIDTRSAVVKESFHSNASPEIDDRSMSAMVKPPVHFFGKVTRTIMELWNRKLQVDDEQQKQKQKLLQEVEGLTNFRGSLVSIEHLHGSGGGGGGGGVVEFTTAATVRRLSLQQPGPYGLQRQAVEGVVCITTKDAFLLYNPTTGDTSPWIETTSGGRRQVESIALGFDPASNTHKVICISSYLERCFPETEEYEFLAVEVLTVGDHTWTTGEHKWRTKKVAPTLFSKTGSPKKARFASFVDGPLYCNGEINWQFRYADVFEYIVDFHVGREDFSVALVTSCLSQQLVDSSRHVRSMLMEVDGKIAILMSTSDDQETSSLWIRNVARSRGYRKFFSWRDEKVLIPYTYVCPVSSIEALTGTNFIFIQSHGHIFCYNRMTDEFLPLTIPTAPIHDHFVWGRIMKL